MADPLAYPFPDTWWIEDDRVLGGRFPGSPDGDKARRMAVALVEMDVRLIINLQEPCEEGREGSVAYERQMLATARRRGRRLQVAHEPIPDHGVPSREQAIRILDRIDAAIAGGGRVYVHCWGGHGRTGLVAGCLHRRRGRSEDEALQAIADARAWHVEGLARIAAPQTPEQVQFVRSFDEDRTGHAERTRRTDIVMA